MVLVELLLNTEDTDNIAELKLMVNVDIQHLQEVHIIITDLANGHKKMLGGVVHMVLNLWVQFGEMIQLINTIQMKQEVQLLKVVIT
jgi:hypothetical protein